jgi:hypothetical protein
MENDSPIVEAHSVAEAYLYLKVTACPRCQRGMLVPTVDLTCEADAWQMPCTCQRCRKSVTLRFRIDPPPSRAAAQSRLINPTKESSRAIDLLGWLNLFQHIVTAAGRTADRTEGRELAMEAAACLDEALKFYEGDNEIPPMSAFFSDDGKATLRNHPERFARSTWIERRMSLPKATSAGPVVPPSTRKRGRWWPFKKRRESP